MKCANCVHENEADAEFCENCGAPLTRTCTNCGAPVKPTAKFCKRCGTEQKILATRASIEGERKPVTILFTDIVGSTSLAEKFDPEDWKEIVSEAHRIVSEAVYRYGGTIAQLLGDGVLAFFGAPVTHEDDPVRAVRAALDIQDGMADYGRRLAGYVENWKMRVGLNTGMVVVGNVGSDLHMEYLAIGDSVNLAARLQSAAQPGRVLISEYTHRSVAHAFDCVDLGEMQVRGKAEPVRVYEVERLKPRPERTRGLASLQSSMVGRNAELHALLQAGAAVRNGLGRVALIIGEPGLGKSRLIAEWKAAADGSERWVEGHCLSYGQGVAYHIIVEMLRSLLELAPTADEAETRDALIHLAQELLGESASEVYPYLGHLLSLQLEGDALADVHRLDPQNLHGQYLAALRRLLLALAARDPLALVLEDIHWADASSAELLIDLFPLTTEAPVLLCFTTRPDHDVPGWKLVTAARETAESRLVEVMLHPLSQFDSRALVSNLLEIESLPEQVPSLILQKAEGNPFFVEEVVRMLIDRGMIVKQGEAWVAREEIANVEIPGSLQALLLARIDRLVDELKRTLRAASVIGRQFSFDVLERVLSSLREGAQGRTLANYLSALGNLGFVRQLPSLPELEYLFRHALVQEAAYQATLRADRRILHRAVGEAIETLFSQRLDEFSPMLAFHFERGEDWTRAQQWLTRAAERAFAQMALPEAMDLYRRALSALRRLPSDPQTEFEQRFKLGQCMMMTGVPREETFAEYERCLALAPDGERRAEVHFRIGELFHIYTSSDLSVAERHYTEALGLLGDNETTELYCKVLGYLGYLYRYQWKQERAAETLERALRLAQQLGSTEINARVLNFLSGTYLDLGREEEALSAGLRGLEFAEGLGNLELIGLAHSFLTDIYLRRAFAGKGAPDDALPHIQEMRRHGREYGVNPLAGFGASDLALYYELKGDREAAVEAWQEGARAWSAAHASKRAAYCCANYGRLLLERGEAQAAERVFAQVREMDGPDASAWAELWIGLAYAGAGQETPALARLERAFALAESAELRRAWLTMIRTDLELAKQRSLPGVAALLERVEAMQSS